METENYREMEQALNGMQPNENGICALRLHIPNHCRGGPCKKKGTKHSFCFCISGRPYENKFSTASGYTKTGRLSSSGLSSCGESGIRTRGTVTRTSV